MRNFRYSLRLIRPSSQTTIDATVSLPWNRRDVEALDAARQRRQRQHRLQRLERVVLRRGRLVEAGLVGERRVAVREIDEAALLAALRHHDAHAPAGALRQPALERVALVGLGRHVHFRTARSRSS